MTQPTLESFLANAAPPLAWQFREVGDRHAGTIDTVEIRQGIDSDREPLVDDDGSPIMLPVFTMITDGTGEINSLYGKPALVSALVTGLKRAGIDPVGFIGHEKGTHLEVTLSSLGIPSKASWSAPQRFTVVVTPFDPTV